MGQGSARYNSITDQEKKLVMDSWAEIRPNMFEFSHDLFELMIDTYPYFVNYWPYNNKNPTFVRFSKQFIREFDFYVTHIHSPSKILPIIQKHANTHVAKKIPNIDYYRLRKCIITKLAEQFNHKERPKDIQNAWIKVISICFSFILEMMEDLANVNDLNEDVSFDSMTKI